MLEEYNLYLIEDKPLRHMVMNDLIEHVNQLLEEKNSNFRFKNGNKELRGDEWGFPGWKYPPQNEKFLETANEDDEQIYQEIGHGMYHIYKFLSNNIALMKAVLDPKSIILLDLNLNTGLPTKWWNKIEKATIIFEQELKDIDAGVIDWANALETEINFGDRIAFLIAGVRISKDLPLLLVTTHKSEVAVSLDQKEKKFTSMTNFPEITDKENKTSVQWSQILRDPARELIDLALNFTKYHEDIAIDKALKMYGSMCLKGKNTWTHDDFSTEHRTCIQNWLNAVSEDQVVIDDSEAKALMMVEDCNELVQQFQTECRKKNTINIPYYNPKYYKVKAKTLHLILKALDIQISNTIPIEIEQQDLDKKLGKTKEIEWALPITPGLTFFLALKEFIFFLKKEAPPEALNFERVETKNGICMYSILIKMKTSRKKSGELITCEPFALVNNYMGEGSHGNNSDTSRRLENLLSSKIGLKSKAAWLKVFTTKKYKTPPTKNRETGAVFPPVGVCFYPYGLRLVWAEDKVEI